MVLLPDCKCCGGGGPCWRCYTDVDTVGYDAATYQCVGPDDTPPDGFLPVGDCHKTQAECEAACCWRCYTDVDTVGYDAATYQCVGPDDTPPDGFLPVGDCHKTQAECEAACGPWQCFSHGATPDCNCPDGSFFISELEVSFEDVEVVEMPPSPPTAPLPPDRVRFLEDAVGGWINGIKLTHDPGNPVLVPGPGPLPSPQVKWDFTCSLIRDNSANACSGKFLYDGTSCSLAITVNGTQGACLFVEFMGERINSTTVASPVFKTGEGYQEEVGFPSETNSTLILGFGGRPKIAIPCLPEGPFEIKQTMVGPANLSQINVYDETCVTGGAKPCFAEYRTINGSMILKGNIRYAEDAADPVVYLCDGPEGNLDSGWTPVGDPHPDEASCEAACGTTKRSRTMPTTKATTGPGTQLKNLLGWVGIRAKEKGCKCGHMEKKMNQGPQWCRDHKDEILDHLEKEAKKRGLPFVRMAAGKLVDLAIRRAERGQ